MNVENYSAMSLDEFIRQPDTVDFAYDYSSRFRKYILDKPYIKVGTVLGGDNFVVAYTKKRYMDQIFKDLGSDYVTVFPQLLTPLGTEALSASHILQTQTQPYLNLRGNGVVVGFVDTGIDYTLPAFRFEDGTSKIKHLWDQTVPGAPPRNMRFGSVYSQAHLTQALKSPNPLQVVPSVDFSGHGTFLAGVAAGRGENPGAAPDAELVVVKLRPANKYHLERFDFSDPGERYLSTDFMLGIKFILDRAAEADMPAVICVSMGVNFGGHNGDTLLERYISLITARAGTVCVAAAGNESNKRHHTQGRLEKPGATASIPVSVGPGVKNLAFHITYAPYEKIPVEIVSPIGETTGTVKVKYNAPFYKKMVMEASAVTVEYYVGASTVAIIDIQDPTPGVWNAVLHAETVMSGEFDAWMPLSPPSGSNAEFLRPSPNSTVTVPATAPGVICVGAYNHRDNSLYAASSWGPTLGPRLAPDFVAPGVEIKGRYPAGVGAMTGSSAAAAITAGACALLLEWGVVRKNEPNMDQDRVKSLIISGCARQGNITYPNPQWGFGALDLMNVFEFLKD